MHDRGGANDDPTTTRFSDRGLLPLAGAATAYAECAWVLWGAASTGTIADLMPWTTREECEAKRTLVKSRENFQFLPACLPNTVDPRGPTVK